MANHLPSFGAHLSELKCYPGIRYLSTLFSSPTALILKSTPQDENEGRKIYRNPKQSVGWSQARGTEEAKQEAARDVLDLHLQVVQAAVPRLGDVFEGDEHHEFVREGPFRAHRGGGVEAGAIFELEDVDVTRDQDCGPLSDPRRARRSLRV